MDRLDWDALRTLQGNLSSNHQNYVHNIMANASSTNSDWDNFCKFARHTVAETQSSMGWEGVGPPSQNAHAEEEEEEVEHHDGEPLEEDPELARKRLQLREIEEQIFRKKASLALKSVEPSPDTSCKGATLKERVDKILQQRKPPGFLAMVNAHKERMNSSKNLRQDDHPLKLRVKALMKQRPTDPFVPPARREVPEVTLPPPDHSVTSPAKESGINEGFQRFLSVLNKGVDMDFLSRIVNDDSEVPPLGADLLNIQPHAVENKSDLPFSKEQPDSGASPPGHRETNSVERKTDPTSQLRALSDRLSLPSNNAKTTDRGGHPSSSGSKSPPALKKKEEAKPKVDEQHQQLQNILKTLGLSLEVEEMSKLTDRTQERLYGKKQEDKGSDSRGEQESRQRSPQRHYSKSSSSSRSSSRSYSRSPSSRYSSHSRDSRRRSESRHSRDRSRDRLNYDGGEAQRYRDEERQYPNEISAYQHPYPENHTYPQPYPAAGPSYPDYSAYAAYHSGTYSETTNPYWGSSQDANPSSYYPYPPDAYNHFADSTVEPNMAYPHHNPQSNSLDFNLIGNPDLSRSEGQSMSGPRCLQVVNTKPTDNRCLTRLTNRRRRGKLESRMRRTAMRFEKKKLCRKQRKYEAKRNAFLEAQKAKAQAQQLGQDESESEEEKQLPTEEEIKANLRKKLEAFNQKVKEKISQPTNCLNSNTG